MHEVEDGKVRLVAVLPQQADEGTSLEVSPSELKAMRCYVIGGWGDDFIADIFSDVQYAPLNNNGSVGPWTTSQYSIQTGRYGHTAVLYPNATTILVLGGNAGGGQYLNDLQYTTTNGGETAAWTQLSAEFNFPTPRWGHTSITHRDRVYVIGGSRIGGFLNDVQYRSLELQQ